MLLQQLYGYKAIENQFWSYFESCANSHALCNAFNLKLTSRLRSASDSVSLSAMSTTSQGMTSKVMNLYT